MHIRFLYLPRISLLTSYNYSIERTNGQVQKYINKSLAMKDAIDKLKFFKEILRK